MANTIEIILKAIDKASDIIRGVEQKTTAANEAMSKSFEGVGTASAAVDKRLSEYGAALDSVTRTQNELRQAQIAAVDAAEKLAKAQKALSENTDPKKFDDLNRELADAQVNLDKAGEKVQNLSKDLREGKEAAGAAQSGFSKMQAAIVTVNQAVDLIGRGLSIAKDVIDQTIGSTITYAKEVRDLSTNLGISAEETSKVIQAADDYGISVGEITSALQMAVKKGFAPNVETLAKLADEYNSIQDPTERAARLTEVFGRNWTALTPMLKEGGQAIRDAAQEAEKLGLVLSDKDVKSARAMEVQVDNLNDRIEALKLKMGKDLLPDAVNLADTLNRFSDIVQGAEDPLTTMNRELGYLISLTGNDSEQTRAQIKAIEDYKQGLKDVADQEAERNRLLAAAAAENIGLLTSVDALNQGVRNQADTYAVLDAAMDKNLAKQNLMASAQAIVNQDMADLKTVMSGALKNEMTQYGKSQDDLKKKLADTAAEIKALERAQGGISKTTVKHEQSTAQLAQAQARLAATQARLAKETDPNKQRELAASIAVQQENIASANQSVVTYVDNSKKIADLKQVYDDTNKAIEENAAAHEEATKRIIYNYAEQQLAIGGFTDEEADALDALAVKLGLKSEIDVAALKKVRDASKELGKNKDPEQFARTVTGAAIDVVNGTDRIKDSLIKVDYKVHETDIHATNLQTTLTNLVKNPYVIQVDYHEQQIPTLPGRTTPLPGGAQHGADFVVPPGFPNDTFPMRVSSGERVQVMPRGQAAAGGVSMGDININIGGSNATPDQIKQAVYSGIVEVFNGAAA